MPTTHIIIDNVVANTIVATVEEAETAFPDALCIDADQFPGGIGWIWDGTALHAPEQPAPEPDHIYPQFTSLEMLDLFTDEEQLAVVQATLQVAAVKLWYDRLLAASFVTWADPRTAVGLDALVTAGLLSAQRRDVIAAQMQGGVTA